MQRSAVVGLVRSAVRVAHVISSPEGVGGAERVLAELVSGGAAKGWTQLIVQPFARDGGSAVAALNPSVPHRPVACSHWIDLPGLRARVHAELLQFRPDVVHSHLFHAGVVVASLRLPTGVLRVWSHHHGSLLRDQGRRASHLLERVATRRYDAVVAVSGYVGRFLTEDCGVPPERVHVVRNGWHGRPVPRDPSPRRPTVVSVGNFRPEKDHETLLRAIALVHRELPEVRLVLLGEGPLRPSLERSAQRLGIRDAVEFRGAVDDVWPHLARADVFALSSIVETLGIAVLEAMAAGLPTVTTDVGGLPEVVEDGRTGVLVPARDPQAMAAGLSALLRDGQRRRAMAAAARVRAMRMQAEDMVDAYADVYAMPPRDLRHGIGSC